VPQDFDRLQQQLTTLAEVVVRARRKASPN
jgi:hypothetical protein